MATCNIGELITDACASGFKCLSEEQYRALILQLLCNISEGGGGGTQQVFLYTGAAPVTNPDDPALPAISYKEDGSGPTFYWNVSAQAWN